MSGTPPGWYPDAQGVTRWFDGTGWTEHTQDVAPQAPPAPPVAAPQPPAQPPATPWSQPAASEQPTYAPGYPPAGPPAYSPPQPPYGQQPYGQQPYGAPTSSPQRRTGLIAALSALAVLVVVGVVVGIVLLTGGDDDDTDKAGSDTTTSSQPTESEPTTGELTASSAPVTPSEPEASEVVPDPGTPAGSPEEVADGFMAAIFAGDCDAAESFVSEELIATQGSCGTSDIPTGTFDGLSYTVGTAEVTGDAATVPIDLSVDLGGDTPGTALPGSELTLSLERSGDRWLVTDLA